SRASRLRDDQKGVVMAKPSRRDRADTEKRALLRTLIDREGAGCTNAIIFCNRKIDVDAVAKSLKKHGYDAAPIHGDLEQSQRTRTLDAFRAGELKFLVASDVAARGLSVPAVSHVFNFDVPGHPEDYVHRIGRTGRAGLAGKALMICNPKDEKNFAAIEALLQKDIPRLENPVTPSTTEEPERDEAAAGIARTSAASRQEPQPQGQPQEDAGRARGQPCRGSCGGAVPEQAATPEPARQPRRRRPRRTQPQAPAPEPQPAPAPEATAEAHACAAGPANRPSRRRGAGRGGDNGASDQNGKIVGMGDHMPTFIALSFEERRAG
ncbi:MAG: C-terminal helicase domain-containing protein, partial [Roseovarius sp.]|nr:C-terminal helicase domain-containing protein [Roseovarius sp.]